MTVADHVLAAICDELSGVDPRPLPDISAEWDVPVTVLRSVRSRSTTRYDEAMRQALIRRTELVRDEALRELEDREGFAARIRELEEERARLREADLSSLPEDLARAQRELVAARARLDALEAENERLWLIVREATVGR